jgi:hypothetical protein
MAAQITPCCALEYRSQFPRNCAFTRDAATSCAAAPSGDDDDSREDKKEEVQDGQLPPVPLLGFVCGLSPTTAPFVMSQYRVRVPVFVPVISPIVSPSHEQSEAGGDGGAAVDDDYDRLQASKCDTVNDDVVDDAMGESAGSDEAALWCVRFERGLPRDIVSVVMSFFDPLSLVRTK